MGQDGVARRHTGDDDRAERLQCPYGGVEQRQASELQQEKNSAPKEVVLAIEIDQQAQGI